MMHYFCIEAAPQLAGAFDRGFFAGDLLRAKMVQPLLWHACAATAAMYLQFSDRAPSSSSTAQHSETYTFALREYNTAISLAVEMAQRQHLDFAEKETLVMASLLFVIVAILAGNAMESLTHFFGSAGLFQEWRLWESSPPQSTGPSRYRSGKLLPMDSLVALFNRLACQRLILQDGLRHNIATMRFLPRRPKPLEEPFDSLTDAYFELEPLYNRLWVAGAALVYDRWEDLQQPARDIVPDIRHKYRVWKQRYDEFCAHNPKALEDDLEASLLLRLRTHLMPVMIASDPADASTLETFDRFAADGTFRAMVDLTAKVKNMHLARLRRANRRSGIFSMSFSGSEATIIAAICCCADLETRHRAIGMMQDWPLLEGMFDMRRIRVRCETYARIEEAMATSTDPVDSEPNCRCVAGEYVCFMHRINSHSIRSTQNKFVFSFRTVGDVMRGRPFRSRIFAPAPPSIPPSSFGKSSVSSTDEKAFTSFWGDLAVVESDYGILAPDAAETRRQHRHGTAGASGPMTVAAHEATAQKGNRLKLLQCFDDQ